MEVGLGCGCGRPNFVVCISVGGEGCKVVWSNGVLVMSLFFLFLLDSMYYLQGFLIHTDERGFDDVRYRVKRTLGLSTLK